MPVYLYNNGPISESVLVIMQVRPLPQCSPIVFGEKNPANNRTPCKPKMYSVLRKSGGHCSLGFRFLFHSNVVFVEAGFRFLLKSRMQNELLRETVAKLRLAGATRSADVRGVSPTQVFDTLPETSVVARTAKLKSAISTLLDSDIARLENMIHKYT